MGRLIFASLCLGLGLSEVAWAAGPIAKSRREFAQSLNSVKEGMTEAEVLALLGKPDDVHTQIDWGSMFFNARKMWRYGAAGHRRAATLGQICFDQGNKVSHVSGQGTPPPEGLFTEPELRNLLEALFDLPSYNAGSNYNPRPVIRAVNLLQPLGKEKALAAIDEFLRVSCDLTDRGREGVFLLLRTLFDVPDGATVFPFNLPSAPGYMPRMLVGGSLPVEPNDKKLIPRFPITIEGDIPFLLIEGYQLFGSAEPPESHVAYFRKFGSLRANPLVPTARPLEVLEDFEKSPRWYFGDKNELGSNYREDEPVLLRNQLLNLLDTVYATDVDEPASSRSPRQVEEQKKRIAEVSKLAIRWDNTAFKYTFLNGTSLPVANADRYRLWSWKPEVAGLNSDLTIRRKNRRYVEVVGEENYEVGKRSARGAIRVFEVKAKDAGLFEYFVGTPAGNRPDGELDAQFEGGTSRGRATYQDVRLDEQAEIQAELIVDGKVLARSAVFKP